MPEYPLSDHELVQALRLVRRHWEEQGAEFIREDEEPDPGEISATLLLGSEQYELCVDRAGRVSVGRWTLPEQGDDPEIDEVE